MNLPEETTAEKLKEVFGAHGTGNRPAILWQSPVRAVAQQSPGKSSVARHPSQLSSLSLSSSPPRLAAGECSVAPFTTFAATKISPQTLRTMVEFASHEEARLHAHAYTYIYIDIHTYICMGVAGSGRHWHCRARVRESGGERCAALL